jgi:hypothetical protein
MEIVHWLDFAIKNIILLYPGKSMEIVFWLDFIFWVNSIREVVETVKSCHFPEYEAPSKSVTWNGLRGDEH